jgi:hypothetical protein
MNRSMLRALTCVLALSSGAARADEAPIDCDKADQISEDDMKAYNDNPLQAIMNKAKTSCTYAQKVAQKAKPASKLPSASGFKQVSGKTVAAAASGFWSGSDDNAEVQVLGGTVTGSGWQTMTMSDLPGVPSARTLGVAHGFKYKGKCYVAYGQLKQNNVNHPSTVLPPAWSAAAYQASDYAPPERVECSVAAKMSR